MQYPIEKAEINQKLLLEKGNRFKSVKRQMCVRERGEKSNCESEI
jgi:hypothetical protein